MKPSNAVFSAFLVAALSAPALATAPDEFRIGQPIIGGSGCPAGTAQAVMSEDGSTISVLFDQYVAQTEPSAGPDLDYKSCNVAIPVHVPQGLSVALMQLDFRGYHSIPHGGSGEIRRDYFFAGQRGVRLGPTYFHGDGDIFLTDNLAVQALVWSSCGIDTNARVNTAIIAKRPAGSSEEALVVVDSVDVTAGLVFHLRWRTCH
jgi:hypothetical protein